MIVCFLFQIVIYYWYIKGCGICYPVCFKVNIKNALLLMGKTGFIGVLAKPLANELVGTGFASWYQLWGGGGV